MNNKNGITICGNKIFVSGKAVIVTNENIEQAETCADDALIILLSYPKRTKLSDEQLYNLVKFDTGGKQIWRISYADKLKKHSPIVGFDINNDNQLSASDFYGRAFNVDMLTGTALMNGITG